MAKLSAEHLMVNSTDKYNVYLYRDTAQYLRTTTLRDVSGRLICTGYIKKLKRNIRLIRSWWNLDNSIRNNFIEYVL